VLLPRLDGEGAVSVQRRDVDVGEHEVALALLGRAPEPHRVHRREDELLARRERHRLRRLAVGQDEDVGQLFVDRRARGQPRGERGAVAGQRAVGAGAPRDPSPGGVLVDLEPRHRVVGQRGAHPVGLDGAATPGDHRRGPAERLEHDLFLAGPECRLALAVEESGDRLPQPFDERGIGVDGLQPAGKRRLARPHEADQDECHPMRSS
jgi:hypothetical protein